MAKLFQGARLKIEWANEHIHKLNSIITEFLKTDFYRLGVEKDPEDGLNVVVLEMTSAVPTDLPFLIGDAVHNLRTALDYAACDIIRHSGETIDKWSKFPIRQSRQELIAAINGGKMKRAGQALVDVIVDTIKPYKGGNHALVALHDLDIQDKHTLPIPVFSVISLNGVDFHDERGNRFEGASLNVARGGKLQFAAMASDIKITNHGKAAFQVLFDEGSAIAGLPVIPTLHHLSRFVSGSINALEKVALHADTSSSDEASG